MFCSEYALMLQLQNVFVYLSHESFPQGMYSVWLKRTSVPAPQFIYYAHTFEMWCWRRMEKISWTDHVRTEEVLLRVKEQRNIRHEINKQKASWIGHILHRNCLLKQVIEGKINGGLEVTKKKKKRCKKLLYDLKERRGYSHLKEEALDRAMWRTRLGRGFGPVVRQNTE
jgi:hypothetical protein